ncbi:hypothetical protein J7T55_002452 [Diaporthe amygdali]|uniref:uncharacterized protein n=1 Tax=Phomopsis amygdali TaxID=1214568 RepID=UPI0022FECAC9|nr:uncharacterized protein J7T55_002452 [Diaporthe amygdali]KAJ0121942.1 hypothetical protein J7T55_002452 [Diaporthe amygdali]
MPVGAILANVSTFTDIDPLEAWWNATASYRYRFSPTAQYYTAVGIYWQAATSDLALYTLPPLPIILIAMNILGETDKADGPTSCGVLLITSGIEQGLMIILGSI